MFRLPQKECTKMGLINEWEAVIKIENVLGKVKWNTHDEKKLT